MGDQDFALVIGIAHYPRLRSSLEGPVGDAERMREWLLGPGQVPEANLELVVSNEAIAERPVLDEIDAALDRILHQARPAGRRLYLYFAGHGCSKALDHLALIMANADLEHLNLAMNATEYRQCLATRVFPEQLYFFDCCRNYDAGVIGRGPPWTLLPDAAPLPGLTQVVLYAAGFTEYANERHLLYSERRGLFTEALLEGLYGGAATFDISAGTWTVSTRRLIPFVTDTLHELTRQENVTQHMWTDTRGVQHDLVLATGVKPPPQRPVSVVVPSDTRRVTLFDDRVGILEMRDLADGPAAVTFELRPGQYAVRAEPSGATRPFNLVDRPLEVDLRDWQDATPVG
jgi:hypothetical protein